MSFASRFASFVLMFALALILAAAAMIAFGVSQAGAFAGLPETVEPPRKPIEPPTAATPAAAPIVTIKAPRSIDMPHLVHVEIEASGGPVRELEIDIQPEPDPDDLVYETADRRKFCFTAPPGVYTIEVLAIGAEKGFAREEARLQIRDPRPPQIAAPSLALAQPAASSQPEELLRQWVAGVNSSNRQLEALEVAKAARETAGEIRAGRADPARAVEDWKTAAYLRMGKAFAAWNANPNGKSFFAYAGDLFVDSAGLRDFNPANLLDSLADILEGN